MNKKLVISFLLIGLIVISILPTIVIASNTNNTIQGTLNINLEDLNTQPETRDPRGVIAVMVVLITIAIITVLVSWWYRTNY